MLEFMNFNGLLHCCSKDFNCLTKCKHMLQKEKKKKPPIFTLQLMALMFDHKILTVLSTIGGCGAAGKLTYTHTQPGPGLICGDHCTDPDQIRCQSTKLPSFPLVVAEWEQRHPPTSLRTAGLKGESHVRLNFRLDQKECDLGLGRQQSLSAQRWGFGGGEDPRHQIVSGKTMFSQELSEVTLFLCSSSLCHCLLTSDETAWAEINVDLIM